MKFSETSSLYSLNKSTYVNLRWIAYIGQIVTIMIVQFILEYKFNYTFCILIISISILTNIYLKFRIKENQLNNYKSSVFLFYDIFQLSVLFFFTGGIKNPFIILIIIPAVFSAQYLKVTSTITLSFVTILNLIFLSFYSFSLPHPEKLHFHVPDFYLYSIPLAVIIGLIFLVYFGIKFGNESRIRKQAFDKMQEIMAKENELVSLGGQAAAAAHSLGTPLSTIMLISSELKKELKNYKTVQNDLDLLISQSNRCSDILKKLTLNPKVEDKFLDSEFSMKEYIEEIINSYQEISKKSFIFNSDNFKNKIKLYKSVEIIYGLRNFIGNANKFSIKKIEIFLNSDKSKTEIIIRDDGPGFPKDLLDQQKLGEPYIRTTNSEHISKYGLGLGTFIGKSLLEKNFAKINFDNLSKEGGAEVKIIWKNKDLGLI